jgi:hypothetical protein
MMNWLFITTEWERSLEYPLQCNLTVGTIIGISERVVHGRFVRARAIGSLDRIHSVRQFTYYS